MSADSSGSGAASPQNKRARSEIIDDLNNDVHKIRIKEYPEGCDGPFIVFIRKKIEQLNLLRISESLKKYSSVTLIKQVHQDKLRIALHDREEANCLVKDAIFTNSYKVYAPSAKVEVLGVIYTRELACETLAIMGTGKFKDPRLNSVPILDAQRLVERSQNEDGSEIFVSSAAIKITFSGTVLPQYVSIENVLIPVRPFSPKPMHCSCCKQFGHTHRYCPNKYRCGKCGERHDDSDCQIDLPRCVHCKQENHPVELCVAFKTRQTNERRRVRQHAKQSYAEALKSLPEDTVSVNQYDILLGIPDSDEICENFPANASTRQGSEHPKPKRQKQPAPEDNPSPIPKPSRGRQGNSSGMPPGFQVGANSEQNSDDIQTVEFFINFLMEVLEVPATWKTIIEKIIPFIVKIWSKCCSKWPTLRSISNLLNL